MNEQMPDDEAIAYAQSQAAAEMFEEANGPLSSEEEALHATGVIAESQRLVEALPPPSDHVEGIWAVLSDNPDGTEGILAVPTPGGQLPLVAIDEPRARALVPLVAQIVALNGVEARIVHFTRAETIETVLPS